MRAFLIQVVKYFLVILDSLVNGFAIITGGLIGLYIVDNWLFDGELTRLVQSIQALIEAFQALARAA